VFSELREKWTRQGLGTIVCGTDTLQPMRAMLADDTTWFASSRKHFVKMTEVAQCALAEHGSNLNVDKCLAQTTCPGAQLHALMVNGQQIPIVSATNGFKRQGAQYTLERKCTAELSSRMSAAWAKFHALVGRETANSIRSHVYLTPASLRLHCCALSLGFRRDRKSNCCK